MQDRHLDMLAMSRYAGMNADEISDLIQQEVDSLPDGMRTPTADEVKGMLSLVDEMKASGKKSEVIKQAICDQFNVMVLPDTVKRQIKNTPHPDGNRRTRRMKESRKRATNKFDHACDNNRKMTKARKNNKLLNKMSAFAMWRMDNLLRTRKM